MTCIVIGSGPSGSNAALTLLERGKRVELWDVGIEDPEPPHPEADFHGLKAVLSDPQRFFLGEQFEALLGPDSEELLRYPPSRRFLAHSGQSHWPFVANRFTPFISFARGGLGVGWGANAVSYDQDDLRDWPITFEDLRSAYEKVARRVPIAGTQDRLSEFFPGVSPTQPPVPMTSHDAALLGRFEQRAAAIARRCGIVLGRSRLAVITAPDDAASCRRCGRCLWGCPHGSLYNPATTTLRQCERYASFRYVPGRLVLGFKTHTGRVRAIRFLDTSTGREESVECGEVFLAAGALLSGAIFLRTLRDDSRELDGSVTTERTESVMDTAVLRIPYIQLRCIGVADSADRLQYNSLIIAHRIPSHAGWPVHCHGQVLSLPPLLYHRLIESIPLGSRLALRAFVALRSAIGTVTYFFADRPAPGNGLGLVPDPSSPTGDRIEVHYRDCIGKEPLIRRTKRDTLRALRMLGCIASKPIRGADGAGIHYAGTVPMGTGAKCCDRNGRSNRYENLYICDGAAFPTLPSKSITLNLMAHAVRVAELARV